MQRIQDTFVERDKGRGAQPGTTDGVQGGTQERAEAPECVTMAETNASAISQVDLLRYIADMAEELQYMSERSCSTTLTGLLALAHAEANLQQRLHREVRRAG